MRAKVYSCSPDPRNCGESPPILESISVSKLGVGRGVFEDVSA